MGITKKKWIKASDCRVAVEGEDSRSICTMNIVREDEYEENADLIIEAGNVYNETGLTPRELKEQRDGLLEALKELSECDKLSTTGYGVDAKRIKKARKKAQQAINKTNKGV